MRKFEVHITGDSNINSELDSLGIKNIIVDLLDKDLKFLRREYMSSFITEANTYEECKMRVDDLVNKLKSKIIRVKIESPAYEDYFERAVYIESHSSDVDEFRHLPLSQNALSGKMMVTDRTYNKEEFIRFDKYYNDLGCDVELCLFDDYIREDFDWFNLYK